MKKIALMLVLTFLISLSFSSCSKKPVDKRKQLSQYIKDGKYRKAKEILIVLRGNYPNDKTLTKLEDECDTKIAEQEYKKYWAKAEKIDTWKEWVKTMIKIKRIENHNKKMVDSWIKRATAKCIDAGAKQLDDGALLGLLNKLMNRYQVITNNDRLMYITMFFKEGRFPLKDWKDTFISKYPELMDGDKFVGYPRPQKTETKKSKKK